MNFDVRQGLERKSNYKFTILRNTFNSSRCWGRGGEEDFGTCFSKGVFDHEFFGTCGDGACSTKGRSSEIYFALWRGLKSASPEGRESHVFSNQVSWDCDVAGGGDFHEIEEDGA